jgi:hypothetical protein
VVDGEDTIEHARRLRLDGECERALVVLARLLDHAPLHAEAIALSADCRSALECECMSSVGSESTIFVAAVSSAELRRFPLDNVSGFLFSLVDGATTVEAVLDICGLPRLLALRHLRSLLERGIIAVASGTQPGSRAANRPPRPVR